MASSSQAPRVGGQSYNDSDHATQLLADIAALREHRANAAQRKPKNVPRTLIDSVFKSMEGYVKKSRDQPSVRELQTDIHASEKANETLRKNTIHNIVETLTSTPSTGTRPKTYAQAANAWKAPSQCPTTKTL
jgi:hypothetical protein